MNNTRKPEQGNMDNLFQRLSEYIGTFDKTWIERIKPASPESVALLKKQLCLKNSDWQLPVSFRIYLEKMGADDGGLLYETLLASTDIDSMIWLCDIEQEDEGWEDDETEGWEDDETEEREDDETEEREDDLSSSFTFFDKHMGGGYAFDLSGKNFDRVMYINDDAKFTHIFSENFEKLLFQCACAYCERKKPGLPFSYPQYYIATGVAKATAVIDKLGLEKAWFSDRNHTIWYGDNVCVDLQHDGGCGRVSGENARLVNEIADILEREADASIMGNTRRLEIKGDV